MPTFVRGQPAADGLVGVEAQACLLHLDCTLDPCTREYTASGSQLATESSAKQKAQAAAQWSYA
jgi:hypothetical protein